MRSINAKTATFWIGSILVFSGVVLMVIWAWMTLGNSADAVIKTPTFSPTETGEVDLLIPTRTLVPNDTNTVTVEMTVDTLVLTPTRKPTATFTPSPLIPTLTQTQSPTHTTLQSSATPTATNTPAVPIVPSATSSPEATDVVPPSNQSFLIPKADIYRIGVSLPYGVYNNYDLKQLGVGWVMDWNVYANPPVPSDIEFVQTVRLKNGLLTPDAAILAVIAVNLRGATWLISNEPDVRWQDNITPETYARLYHDAYHAIITSDPTAIVAAGGIAQPSQLRFEYLDRILAAYQSMYGVSMPLQAWQIHNYILREERDSWGIDIPPGISAQQGVLYSIDDTGNITAFKSQIYNFRRWMADRGYRNSSLIVSEFGIPMPPDYGFDLPRVSDFLSETWHFFYTTTDPVTGYPADGGRLVQRWCWFSLGVEEYPAGNLISPPDGDDWTPLASVWRGMIDQ